MNIWKPKFYLDWQEHRDLVKAQAVIDSIHRLGGFTQSEMDEAIAAAREEGIIKGVEEANEVAGLKLSEVVRAVSSVLELNDLNVRTLLAKVRAHLREAEKIRKQKSKLAEQKRQEMTELLEEARTAEAAANGTSHVLDVMFDVNLNSKVDLSLSK